MKFLLASVALLLLGTVAQAQQPDLDKLLERYTFTHEKASLPYRLMKPAGYDPNGKERYPLVVFLHGVNGRGTDNARQLRGGVDEFVKVRQKYPCFLLVPQCPPDQMWVKLNAFDGRNNVPFVSQPTAPMQLVLDLIDTLVKEHRIDKDRLYVTGYSMGGYGTWDIITRRPDLFAEPLVGDPEHAAFGDGGVVVDR